MSDMFSSRSGTQEDTERVCRVAYTLNNAQPVACTIIGDQPLFYMDYECDYEDEDVFDAAEMRILENELLQLTQEMESFDNFGKDFQKTPEECFVEFLSDKDTISEPFTRINTEGALERLKESLEKSRLAKAYMDFASEQGVEIKFSSQIEDAYYDRRGGSILINPERGFEDQLLLTVRELRRHWQHRQGALIHPLMFHPDNAVLVNRVQVADLVVSMIRVAWELQLSGMKEAWERIENSSMADLGRIFAREAFSDFRTLNNGQASAAVFEGWFLSERCRHEDKNMIQQMLADYQGYVFDLEEAEKSITPSLISAIGAMPYGKNYLAAHVQILMDDAIFTDVRDRSNANFLWFIKFERSFRETEQELQETGDHVVDGVRHTALPDQTEDHHNGREEATEIVSLFADSEEEPRREDDERGKRLLSSKPKKSQETGGAEIIYLRRWSGE